MMFAEHGRCVDGRHVEMHDSDSESFSVVDIFLGRVSEEQVRNCAWIILAEQ